ncbi:hypothetical protein CLOM_g22039 [Closterium sp. NIES-68]|nr:hypothetical protein CLOM_g22039 [Closterium sp. NIES-68]GJP77777.1 hypothetical protein CLOP_g8123 [Closterium sp. NIES-67]
MARPVFDSKYPASHVPRQLQAALVVSVVVMLAVLTMHNANMTARSYAIQEDLNRTAAFEELLDRRFQEISVLFQESIAKSNTAHTDLDPIGSTTTTTTSSAIPTNANSILRLSHTGPRRLCTYTESELRGILSLRHCCGWKCNRYFYGGAWIDWKALDEEFQKGHARVREEEEAECVLACKQHENLGCSKEQPCVNGYYLRRNTTDTLVVRQAYEWGEQNFLKPYFQFDSILDAGANIGLTSVLFATMYPKATIVSVEASSRNFRSLKLNTQPFPNIIAVNAALWPRVASLSLTLGHRNPELPPEWAFMVKETRDLEPGQVVEDSLLGVTVPFLLKVFGLPGFDFLKIDIEGSEGEIFREDREADLGWVNQSKLAALELHGDMVPGSNVTVLNFFNSRSNFHHKKDWSGEYEVFMRNDANLS